MSLKHTWRSYRIRRHEKVLARLKADSSSLDTNQHGSSPYYMGSRYTDYSPVSLHPGQSRATQSPIADAVSQVEFHRVIGRIHEDVATVSLRLENLSLQLAGIQQQLQRQANSSSFYGGPQLNNDELFEATEGEEVRSQYERSMLRTSLPDLEPNLDRHRYGTVRGTRLRRETSRDRALREMNNSSLPVLDKLNSRDHEPDSLYSRYR